MSREGELVLEFVNELWGDVNYELGRDESAT